MAEEETGQPAWLGDDYYQNWLCNGLIDSAFPWDIAQSASMLDFLRLYTLHDSALLGVWVPPMGGAVLIVRWDLAWNESVRVPPDEEELRDREARDAIPFWPVLLFRFSGLLQLAWFDTGSDGEGGYISDVISRPVTGSVVEAPVAGQIHETTIHTKSSCGLNLRHAPTVSVLLIARSGDIIRIPVYLRDGAAGYPSGYRERHAPTLAAHSIPDLRAPATAPLAADLT